MSVAGTTTARVVDQKAFRDVVGRFASGVTVITTSVDGQPFRDDRQRHVVPVDGSADAAGLPEQDQRNGRGRAQGAIVCGRHPGGRPVHLAGKFAVKGADKFSGVAVHAGLTGSPLLGVSLATIECPNGADRHRWDPHGVPGRGAHRGGS